MPQVPQYNREVGAQITPTPYRNDRVNEDTFGANIYQAQQRLGRVITENTEDATRSFMRFKEGIDRTKLIEFSNKLQEYKQENIIVSLSPTSKKEASLLQYLLLHTNPFALGEISKIILEKEETRH